MVISGRPQNVILSERRNRPDVPEDTTVNVRAQRRRRREREKQHLQKEIQKEQTEKSAYTANEGVRRISERNRRKYTAEQIISPDRRQHRRHEKKQRFLDGKITKDAVSKFKDMSDAEYEGEKRDRSSAEYTGINKASDRSKRWIRVIGAKIISEILLLIKLVISALTNIIAVCVVVAILVVIVVVAVIQNATYGFVADEEYFIRENYSRITAGLSSQITELKKEYDCKLLTTGTFADPKEVISLWWAIKMNYSDTEYWDSFIEGDDKDGLTYIFYQFNHVTLSGVVEGEINKDGVTINSTNETEDSERCLQVTVTTSSLDELIEHWALSVDQKEYLYELMEDQDVWDEILGTSELSAIAIREQNSSGSKYLDYYEKEDNANLYFVLYCLEQLDLIDDDYIPFPEGTDEFWQTLQSIGFSRDNNYEASSGDLIFVRSNETLQCGIVTVTDGDYLTFCDASHDIVQETTLSRDSGMIVGYAQLGGFYVAALMNNRSSDLCMVATAESQLGVINGNPYWSWYGFPNAVPWCACFVSWVANENGYIESGVVPKFADCVYGVSWFTDAQLWQTGGTVPEAGWIIFFDWPDDAGCENQRDGRPDHVGIVAAVDGDVIYTIEGNSGNAVKRQSYNVNNQSILGYGTPQY